MRNKKIIIEINQLKIQQQLKQLNLIILKRKNYILYTEVLNKTKFLPLTALLKERLYCIEHNLKEIPLCPVCKEKHVHWYYDRYTIACSTKCSHNMESYRYNYEQAMLDIYGNKYPMQCEKIKKQVKVTLKEKYGSETYNNRDKFKNTMINRYGNVSFNNREKAKLTSFKLYGNQNYRNHELAAITNILKYGCSTPLLKKRTKTISSLNKRIFSILNKHHIYFNIEFSIKNKNKRYSYDIKFNNNVILEINGDFWHANPKLYLANDILNMPKGKQVAKNIWKYDKLKNNIAKENNYKIIYIWENDMNNMSDDLIFLYIQYNCLNI